MASANRVALTTKLQKLTQLVDALRARDQLTGEALEAIVYELDIAEEEIEALGGSMAHDLQAVLSIIRGSLNVTSGGLSYADPRYWQEYYNKTSAEDRFDWYLGWDDPIEHVGEVQQGEVTTLGDLVSPSFGPSPAILVLGCGNSEMSAKMYQKGLRHITNVDISEQLLAHMRSELGASMPEMTWVQMNVSALEFDASSFDVVIDKGTLDAIERDHVLLEAAAREAHRVLRPDGILVSVSVHGADVRSERQLRSSAPWGGCQSHSLRKRRGQTASGKEPKVDNSVNHVHVCSRD